MKKSPYEKNEIFEKFHFASLSNDELLKVRGGDPGDPPPPPPPPGDDDDDDFIEEPSGS